MSYKILRIVIPLSILFGLKMCQRNDELNMKSGKLAKIITLGPGYFHAAFVQKNQYDQFSPTVNIYAPEIEYLKQHLKRIE